MTIPGNRIPAGAAVLGGVLGMVVFAALLVAPPALTQGVGEAGPTFPPALPGAKEYVTDSSSRFLVPARTLRPGVSVAETAPVIDFLVYPLQTYPGDPWSVWGDGSAVEGKYYSAIGDHRSPRGTAYVFEYDSARRRLRLLADIRKSLESCGALVPGMDYTPGKVHSRIDLGNDGWLYYATHRGSPRTTTDEYGYKGDWILRTHPGTGTTEIVASHPVPKHAIPNSVLDPDRLIFYGGTAAGRDAPIQGVHFFAYDVRAGNLLYWGPGGPPRYMLFARSSGRVYFTSAEAGTGTLMRYDPAKGRGPETVGGMIGIRAATRETPRGYIYTVTQDDQATLWSFNTRTEEIDNLGPAVVGEQSYVTSLDADPTGRYLYYTPGAHGGSEVDGTPVVQFDTETQRRKVIAFLHPFYEEKYGCTLKGTFSSAVDARGDKLYITWNSSRGTKVWDSCWLTVIHIPESERPSRKTRRL